MHARTSTSSPPAPAVPRRRPRSFGPGWVATWVSSVKALNPATRPPRTPLPLSWPSRILAEGDRVVVRATNTYIQESFLGFPAAGVRQVFTATFSFRISDGLVHEIWRNADDLGRLVQLGARFSIPESARA
jgi:hypothetical protein